MLNKMNSSQQPFSGINILLMVICCILILIGFLLMLGGSSSVEGGFNPDIFSTRRIVVGPLIAFLGFFFMAFAILVDTGKLVQKFRKHKTAAPENTELKEEETQNKE